jgi:diguanylate cyclase
MNPQTTTRESAAVNAVAREALRRIAQERISPTPEAYARVYREIAGTHPDHPTAAIDTRTAEARIGASAIARLITQVDAHHSGITVTKKREGLKRALVPRAESVDALFARLNRLIDSWNGPNAETGAHVSQFLGTNILGIHHEMDPEQAPLEDPPLTASVFSQASHFFSQALAVTRVDPHDAQPTAHPTTLSRAHARAHSVTDELPDRVASVRLAGLLALLLKNIEEITPESGMLGNQTEQIGRVLTAPLTTKKLDEAERCLRALIVRQGAIKHSIVETKRAVRDLAESLLERLSSLMSSTDCYSSKVVGMAERIAEADNLAQLSDLTQLLVSDARLMSSTVADQHATLAKAEARVRTLQARTERLESELREASTLVRTDPLTHAMNRRGFGDAYVAEIARADPDALPTVALIDVDDFKRINEEFGHSVGDEVLCGLVEVLHRFALPANTVARYGGEEFALMFPRTSVEQAERAVVKIQRALIDRTVLDSSKQPPITFSAGVAQVAKGEPLAQVMSRADRALRQAKQAGKNCVVVATFAKSRIF